MSDFVRCGDFTKKFPSLEHRSITAIIITKEGNSCLPNLFDSVDIETYCVDNQRIKDAIKNNFFTTRNDLSTAEGRIKAFMKELEL